MEKFLSFLSDPAPAFVCRAAGRAEPRPPPATIRVTHQFGPPADQTWLNYLITLGAPSLVPYYSQAGDTALFAALFIHQEVSPAFRLFPPSEMEAKTRLMRELAVGPAQNQLYPFQDHGIAIGEICLSGDYFVLYQEAVYLSCHDSGDHEPFATSFPLFLNRIAADPAKFLRDAGNYTRYSDGHTRTQWIPDKYVPNVGA